MACEDLGCYYEGDYGKTIVGNGHITGQDEWQELDNKFSIGDGDLVSVRSSGAMYLCDPQPIAISGDGSYTTIDSDGNYSTTHPISGYNQAQFYEWGHPPSSTMGVLDIYIDTPPPYSATYFAADAADLAEPRFYQFYNLVGYESDFDTYSEVINGVKYYHSSLPNSSNFSNFPLETDLDESIRSIADRNSVSSTNHTIFKYMGSLTDIYEFQQLTVRPNETLIVEILKESEYIPNVSNFNHTIRRLYEDPSNPGGISSQDLAYSYNYNRIYYDYSTNNNPINMGDFFFIFDGNQYDILDDSGLPDGWYNNPHEFVVRSIPQDISRGRLIQIRNNSSVEKSFAVKFGTASNWRIRLSATGCVVTNNDGLLFKIANNKDGEGKTGTGFSDVNNMGDLPIGIDGYYTFNYNNPDSAEMFFKVEDNADGNYENNLGLYKVEVRVRRSNIPNIASNIAQELIDHILTTFYGQDVSELDPPPPAEEIVGGRWVAGNGAIVPRVYSGIVQNNIFIQIVHTMLILYLSFYGIKIAFGAGGNLYEGFLKLFKFAVILTMLQPNSWEFMSTHLFMFFIDGVSELIGLMADPLTYNNDSKAFGFMDKTIGQFFHKPTIVKMTALFIFSQYSVIGILYFILVIIMMILMIVLFAKALLLYIISIIAIALLLFVSPIFISLLLFSQTKSIFDKWLATLVSYALQPIFLFIVLVVMHEFLYASFMRVLAFKVCWDCIISINMLEVILNSISSLLTIEDTVELGNFCLFEFWQIKGDISPFGNSGNDVVSRMPPISFFDIILFFIFLDLTFKFMKWAIKLAEAITSTFNTDLSVPTQKIWHDVGASRVEKRFKSLPKQATFGYLKMAKRLTVGEVQVKNPGKPGQSVIGTYLQQGTGALTRKKGLPEILARRATNKALATPDWFRGKENVLKRQISSYNKIMSKHPQDSEKYTAAELAKSQAELQLENLIDNPEKSFLESTRDSISNMAQGMQDRANRTADSMHDAANRASDSAISMGDVASEGLSRMRDANPFLSDEARRERRLSREAEAIGNSRKDAAMRSVDRISSNLTLRGMYNNLPSALSIRNTAAKGVRGAYYTGAGASQFIKKANRLLGGSSEDGPIAAFKNVFIGQKTGKGNRNSGFD
ncbi:MAG: type IV secretion system protein [Pseudomonadota bacterium]